MNPGLDMTWIFCYNTFMQVNYKKQDILKELRRRFNIIDYGDGTFSLRTKNDWMIYYVGNCNEVILIDHDLELSDVYKSFNHMLGKEMFYFTNLVNGDTKIFKFPSSYEEFCIMNDLEGL